MKIRIGNYYRVKNEPNGSVYVLAIVDNNGDNGMYVSLINLFRGTRLCGPVFVEDGEFSLSFTKELREILDDLELVSEASSRKSRLIIEAINEERKLEGENNE